MKTIGRIKFLPTLLFMLLFLTFFPMQLNANGNEVVIYHHHCTDCEGIEYKKQSATNKGNLETCKIDTCEDCGAELHHYSFYCKCSCGKIWQTTGHACRNSSYGNGNGSCGNYSVIDCSTVHKHPCKSFTCGMDNEEVGRVCIEEDETDYVKEVMLTLCSDCDDEVVIDGYHWGNGESENQIKVTQNGSYQCTVSYTDNGIADSVTATIEVTNIDITPPDIKQLYADITEPTNGRVRIRVEAEDTQSGLHNEPYSWDGTNYVDDNELIVTECGEINVCVRDQLGNVTTMSLAVDNIDTVSPELTLSCSPKYLVKDGCDIIAQASDEKSGLCSRPFSWDEGDTWVDEETYHVTKTGEYKCQVRDLAGNITCKTIKVKKTSTSVTPAYPTTESPSDESNSEENSSGNQTIEETSSKEPKKGKLNFPKEQNTEQMESKENLEDTLPREEVKGYRTERIVVPDTVNKTVKSATKQDSSVKTEKKTVFTPVVKTVVFSVTGLMGAVCLIYASYFYLCTAKIYSAHDSGDKFLGRSPIHKKQGGFKIAVSDSIWDKSESPMMRIKIPRAFVRMFAFHELTVTKRREEYRCNIQKEITL